jgi:phosphoglycerate dehydrogenase-like enzyme
VSIPNRPAALYYTVLKYQPESLAALHDAFEVTELESPNEDTPELLAGTEVLFAPLGFMVDRAKIDACPKLRVVASNTTGHPHIDVDYCRAKGVEVACLKFAQDFLDSITPTAELSFGMIIAVTRNMMRAHEAALSGTWDRRPFGAPAMLSRMKLGVVGLGRLGGKVARMAAAADMDVRYYDPSVRSDLYGQAVDLTELAAWCDVLTIHVPHEPDTEGLISRDIMAAMPAGGYVVNTSRGELIDWAALQDLLASGHLAGAALDVFEGEFEEGFQGRYGEHPFLAFARTHGNVLITPHVGGSTVDAWRETELKTIEMARRAVET